jgi:hypothetical protein
MSRTAFISYLDHTAAGNGIRVSSDCGITVVILNHGVGEETTAYQFQLIRGKFGIQPVYINNTDI